MTPSAIRPVPFRGSITPAAVPARPDSTSTNHATWKLAYSKSEAAELLSISESLLNDLIADGSIRTVSAGRRCLVPLEAMTDFLADD